MSKKELNHQIHIQKAPGKIKGMVFDRIGISTRQQTRIGILYVAFMLISIGFLSLLFFHFNNLNTSDDRFADDSHQKIVQAEDGIDDTLDSLDTLLVLLDEENDLDLNFNE